MSKSNTFLIGTYKLQHYLIALTILLTACAPHRYHAEPIDELELLNAIRSWTVDDPGLNRFLAANGIKQAGSDKIGFSLQRLYLTGLYYDPQLQLAYNKWQKAKKAVDNTDYRLNPEISIPFEHHSDTSDGQSPWTIGAVLSVIYERPGKRQARRALSEAALLNATLELMQLAYNNYFEIKRYYHNYVFTRSQLSILENEIDVIAQLRAQLETEFALGATSQFELSTLDLEFQQRLFEKNRYDVLLSEHREQLLLATHLTRTEFDRIDIEFIDPLELSNNFNQQSEHSSSDLSSLQIQLLESNLQWAGKLNAYAEKEAELKLEIEHQYPDIVLSPGFIFDQSDNIWTLGASWILPMFSNSKQNLKILNALEDRKIKQSELLSEQKKMLDKLYKTQQSVIRQYKLTSISDELVYSTESRLQALHAQIEIGGINQTALLRNKMNLYKVKLQQLNSHHQAIISMQALEEMLYKTDATVNIKRIMDRWLTSVEEVIVQ